MQNKATGIRVFYDGACPTCVRERRLYERLAGLGGKQIEWFDISGRDEYLKSLSIDPQLALFELHLQLQDGSIVSELDAYIILMKRVRWLKPFAWLLSLPVLRPWLAKMYHRSVEQRLRAAGRI